MEVLISEPFYSFVFVGLGLLFLFLEVFIPSGGILGLLSLGCTVFGVYGLFHQDRPTLAVAALAGSTVVTLLGIRFGLQRLSFSGTMTPESSTSVDERIESLVGKEGITHTPLRPAGVAVIEGQRVDVVTTGGFIEQDVRVRVVDTSGNRVVVRTVRAGEPGTAGAEGGTNGTT